MENLNAVIVNVNEVTENVELSAKEKAAINKQLRADAKKADAKKEVIAKKYPSFGGVGGYIDALIEKGGNVENILAKISAEKEAENIKWNQKINLTYLKFHMKYRIAHTPDSKISEMEITENKKGKLQIAKKAD